MSKVAKNMFYSLFSPYIHFGAKNTSKDLAFIMLLGLLQFALDSVYKSTLDLRLSVCTFSFMTYLHYSDVTRVFCMVGLKHKAVVVVSGK